MYIGHLFLDCYHVQYVNISGSLWNIPADLRNCLNKIYIHIDLFGDKKKFTLVHLTRKYEIGKKG
jgi:hypothetical protein